MFYITLCYKLFMEITKKVGNNLKEARKTKGLTQKEVAHLLIMTQQQYSRFETGKYELSYKQILDVCNILCITPNEFFGIE